MSKRLTIRAARPDDAAYLRDLAMRSKAVWGYTDQFMEACREELSVSREQLLDSAHEYLVAERHGEVLGFCGLEYLSPESCELAAMFVEPAHIGTGVGTALITRAKADAAAAGARTLIIQGDPNAVEFYRAAGGVPAGTRESGSIPGRFLPLFRISLEHESPAQ
jgi:predicted N-acetyltransferase YhbS